MITFVTVIVVAGVVGPLLFLFQALRRLRKGKQLSRRELWRRRLHVGLALLLLAGMTCAVWGFLIEPNQLVVNQHTIQIGNWPNELGNLRVALIADIHTGAPFIDDEKLRRIVELTNQQQPDLVIMLGDFMSQNTWHGHRVAPEVTANHLKHLRAPLGVYAVLGNHDWWDDGEKVKRALEEVGIRVLENDVTEIKWRQKSFWLAGLSDAWSRPQHVDETIAKIPSAATVIAFTHSPDVFPNVPSTVPLVLAAHTHGGQVKIPLLGTPIVPSHFGQKYVAGYVFENGHHLFVTTGIGTSILPVRFRVPPEIVILTIGSK